MPSPLDELLLETGDSLLLETGDFLLLETQAATAALPFRTTVDAVRLPG